MISPALVQWFCDKLADETDGVNALAAFVPIEPGAPALPTVAIANAFRDDWVAAGATASEATSTGEWSLIVSPVMTMQLADDPEASTVRDEVGVVIELDGLTAEAMNATAITHLGQLMRVVRRVLMVARRELAMSGIELDRCRYRFGDNITVVMDEPKQGSGQVSARWVVPMTAEDYWAQGF